MRSTFRFLSALFVSSLASHSAFAQLNASNSSRDVRPIFAQSATFPPDETFDELTTPNLPVGWTNTFTGATFGWVTETGDFSSSPNAAFTEDTGTVTDKSLQTAPFAIVANGRLTFRHKMNLEAGVAPEADDGVVLEIAIGGGAFADVFSAGGSFVTGGYDHVILTCCDNPLAGRPAWSGTSADYQLVVVNLPTAANGQNVSLRWRMGTDYSVGRAGYWLDDIHVDANGPDPIDDPIFLDDFDCSDTRCP